MYNGTAHHFLTGIKATEVKFYQHFRLQLAHSLQEQMNHFKAYIIILNQNIKYEASDIPDSSFSSVLIFTLQVLTIYLALRDALLRVGWQIFIQIKLCYL